MTAPIKILFVDDEQLILSALRRALRREGFELYFTADPNAAARLVGEHQIDIVVSDYMMPELSGVEVLALVGRLHHNTARIMMTGQADRDATIRAINEGNIQRFIEKPWDDGELKRILHDVARSIQVRRSADDRDSDRRPLRTLVRDGSGAIVLKSIGLEQA